MMAANIIENISLCRLGGFAGSNPEVIESVFPMLDSDASTLLGKALPHGIEPDHFILEKWNNKHVLSYVFTIKASGPATRDDLASIALLLPADKKINIQDFQVLFKMVIDSFKHELEKLDVSKLKHMIERIHNGINKGEKIAIESVNVDVPSLIKSKKLRLVAEAESIAGRVF